MSRVGDTRAPGGYKDTTDTLFETLPLDITEYRIVL